MGLWRPDLPRKMAVIDLAMGDTPTWAYKLSQQEMVRFLDGSDADMEFKNSFGQTVKSWAGSVTDGYVRFELTPADADDLPRGTTFTLTIEDADGNPRQPLWGHVVRNEARYPDNPDNTTQFVAAKYDYDFGDATGRITDPSWRIMNGAPTVWANSGGIGYGVACGILFDDAAMLWYAPFRGDSIEVNYTTISSGAGKSAVAICSNYDMSNYLCITHEAGIVNNKIHVEVGTSPVHTSDQKSVNHATATGENFTVRYNNLTKTVSVYSGTNFATPLIEWTDDTGLVDHGEGDRYLGLNWRSSLLATGPQFKNRFSAQDIA